MIKHIREHYDNEKRKVALKCNLEIIKTSALPIRCIRDILPVSTCYVIDFITRVPHKTESCSYKQHL